jgi:hypothetical protein
MVIFPQQTCETYEDNNRIEMDLAASTFFVVVCLGNTIQIHPIPIKMTMFQHAPYMYCGETYKNPKNP